MDRSGLCGTAVPDCYCTMAVSVLPPLDDLTVLTKLSQTIILEEGPDDIWTPPPPEVACRDT